MGSFYARVNITDVLSTVSINARVYELEPDEGTGGAPVAQFFCTIARDEETDPRLYLKDCLVSLIEHM